MPIFGGIFIGRRFGAFDSTPAGGRVDDAVGPAFPPAGSYNNTLYGVSYPMAEGGASFYFSPTDSNVPSQTCDVDVLNDGNGGTYTHWASATNINYISAGTHFYTDTSSPSPAGLNQVEVPVDSGQYYDPEYVNPTYEHDGIGGFQTGANDGPYSWPDGTLVGVTFNNQTEVPSGSGVYYDNGSTTDYVWNGSGGYYTTTGGSFYTGTIYDDWLVNVEVPSGSGNYYGDGTGTRYVWAGGGSYGTEPIGSYHPNGTLIWDNVSYTGNAIEIPNGSGNYYDSELFGERYTWDGSGGYNSYSNWYYDSGTYITNDGSYDYYWDGNGGYYS